MHLGDPSGLETTSSSAVGEAMMDVTVAHEGINGGGGGGEMMDTNSGDDEKRNNGGGGEEGDKMNCGGNRWPRQETFALLKIRSDMDAAFRDSSLKGPLWEEVSRKLGELGYHRSAKKCKEKFENVYKYHKRTKESRSGKPEGKTYKFFDQLQALENHQFTLSSHTPTPTSKPPQPSSSLPTNTITLMQSTRPSIDVSETTISYVPPAAAIPSTNPTLISPPPPPPPTNARNVLQQGSTVPYSLPNMNLVSTTSTSSSTASDEDMEARYRKKRKWKDYFRRLTRQVLAEQEEMQKRFLEAIDKRERERVAQQEAWRIQEMARINREHDILVQERSTAAAKDAAVIAFLQKLSGQTPPPPPLAPQPSPPPPQVQPQQQQAQQQLQQPPLSSINNNFEIQKMNNGSGHGQSGSPMSSSRWPKAEVQALIRLRTTLDAKYQENGPKGPLWEDISAGLQRLGYNRSSKRCKEKWENINKYFKKVKESSKQRREDSKTCPYFHELEVLYKEKSKTHNTVGSSFYNSTTKQPNEMMEPLMVQPEQQWRPPPPPPPVMEEQVKEREGGIEEEEEEDIDDVEEDGDSVEDEERYEIATNKLSSVDTVE